MATANYASGCTFQDALASYRVRRGQAATSIDIGWMRDIGIVAETAAFQRRRLATEDMQQVSGSQLLALLDIICDPSTPQQQQQQSHSQILFGLRTPADFLLESKTPPLLLERPLFKAFSRLAGTEGTAPQTGQADVAGMFRAAESHEEKVQVVITALVGKLARAMCIAPDDVETSKPLSAYGVDSLMAVELRNWMRRDFGAAVVVFDIMGGVVIREVGEIVVTRSGSGSS